jgi:hypothetical protein
MKTKGATSFVKVNLKELSLMFPADAEILVSRIFIEKVREAKAVKKAIQDPQDEKQKIQFKVENW